MSYDRITPNPRVVELFFLVSMTVGNSSNRTLHSICGSLSIASSLMLDGRFNTLLKCSAHLFSKLGLTNVAVGRFFLILSWYHLDMPCEIGIFLQEFHHHSRQTSFDVCDMDALK